MTRADGPHTGTPTGTKLFSLQRSFAYMRGLAMVAAPRNVQVYPSGSARETCSQARLPLATGFASTTIGWRHISESLSVTMRVTTSTVPPAGYGKTMWMRRLGKSFCAYAAADTQAAASPEVRPAPARDRNWRRTRFMASSSAFKRLLRSKCSWLLIYADRATRGIPYLIPSLKGLP